MANRHRGQLLKLATEVAAQERPQAVDASGAGAGAASGAAALQAVAGGLDQIGNRIGRWADKAAAIEGADAGRLAGLDPEFRPTKQITHRGLAFDRAGLEIASSRQKVEIERDLAEAYDKHRGNPAKLGEVLAEKRKAWLSASLPELRPQAQLAIDSATTTYVRKATREQASRVDAEHRAALQTDLATRIAGLHQKAYAGGLDEEASDVLAAELSGIRTLLARRGLDGNPLVDPGTAARISRGAMVETTTARILGAFDRIDGLDAKQKFIDDLEADFGRSAGLAKVYDLGEFQQLRAKLNTEYSRARTEMRSQLAGVGQAIASIEKRAAEGYAPRQEELAALKSQVALSGSAQHQTALRQAEDFVEFATALQQQTPQQVAGWLDGERARLKGGASEGEVARVRFAEKLHANMTRAIETDPYGWAERTGRLAQVAPIPLDDPAAAANGVARRIAQRDALSAEYGRELPYLRPVERQALQSVAARGPEAVMMVASTLVRTFGDRAPDVLGEISKEQMDLAALGGLLHETGEAAVTVAQDAAAGMALRRIPKRTPFLGPIQERRPIQTDVLGTSFMAIPQGMEAITDLADAIYEARATRMHLDKFSADEYRKALRDATGEVRTGRNTYGGIGTHRSGVFGHWGRRVLVPAGVRQDAFDDVVDLITDADLAATGHVLRDRHGRPLTAEDIKAQGKMVSLGGGQYLIAMGDPETMPQWAADGKGARAVLDFNRLIPILRTRRPDYFMGTD